MTKFLQLILSLLAIAGAAPTGLAGEMTLTDRASIINAHTIVLRGQSIRLWGIIAPVRDEPGALESRTGAWRLFQDHIVTCHMPKNWGKGQAIGKCEAAGLDLGAVLVSSGFARDCPAISGGHYRVHEQRAKTRGEVLAAAHSLPNTCETLRR